MARLLVLDFPQGHEFGIDWMSWQVGDQFAGINNIPIGYHFVYWAAKENKGSDCSTRSGTFIHIEDESQILVWLWDSDAEACAEMNDDDSFKYRESARASQFDQRLGPYPTKQHDKWINLTKHLTSCTIDRIAPVKHKIGGEWTGNSFYTKLPGRRPSKGTPSEITKYAFDRTQALSEVLSSLKGSSTKESSMKESSMKESSMESAMYDLLGELEYSFVTFVVGQSADGLEQWKKLIDLLCRCEDAMSGIPSIDYDLIPSKCFVEFLHVLMLQLMEVPNDFFASTSELSNNNFLKPALSSFAQLLSPKDGQMLSELAMNRFAWDINEDEEDDPF
jgi:A1 cistron-splicing factor AAR2